MNVGGLNPMFRLVDRQKRLETNGDWSDADKTFWPIVSCRRFKELVGSVVASPLNISFNSYAELHIHIPSLFLLFLLF